MYTYLAHQGEMSTKYKKNEKNMPTQRLHHHGTTIHGWPKGIIIFNDVISEVPSVAIISIITRSGTYKRSCSIHLGNLRHISEPEIALDLVQGPMPNHLRGHIPNYWLVREEHAYTLTHDNEYEDLC